VRGERGDFALGGLVEDEAFAIRGDADDEAAGFGADDHVSSCIKHQRAGMGLFGAVENGSLPVGGDLMDFAAVSGGDVEIALRAEGHGPDVLGLGVVKHFGLALGDAEDFAVRGGGGVEAVLAVQRERLNLEAFERGQKPGAPLARRGGIDLENLGAGVGTAAGGVDAAARVLYDGPKIGDGGVMDFLKNRGEREAAVVAEGELFDGGLFEIRGRAVFPNLGLHGRAHTGGSEENRE
jgi:hypothetical protein